MSSSPQFIFLTYLPNIYKLTSFTQDEAEDLISRLFDAATRLIQKIEDEGSKKSSLFDNNKSNQAIIASLENMMKHLT